MRRLLIAALVGVVGSVSACSGKNTPLAPAAVVVPVVAAPQYPTMQGTWTGSLSIVANYTVTGLGSFTVRTVCNESWRVDGQSASRFTGSFQNSTPAGSTATCVQAGTFGGTVSTSSSLSDVSFNAIIGGSSCTRTGGNGIWSGSLIGTAASLSTTDTIQCPTAIATFVYARTLTLFLTKQ